MTAKTAPALPAASAQGVRKFQFDDFDMEAGAPSSAQAAAVYNGEEFQAAVAAAHAEGRAAGLQDAILSLEADIRRLLETVETQAAAMEAELAAQRAAIAGEALRLTTLIARRVLPSFAESGAAREIEGLIAACLKDRPDEARLVIRLPDALLDPVSARVDRLVAENGFAGKPVLLADPALRRTEARVEWANGGADWNFEGQLGEIEAAAKRLAAARPVLSRANAATVGPDVEPLMEDPLEESDLCHRPNP